ncbi:MAG: DNA translocase FtsK [Desulfonatronovibrionaceae bacterium]
MDGNRLIREFAAVIVFFLALFAAVSLYSFWPTDPTFNQQVGSGYEVHNMAGVVGSYLAGTLVELFGVVSLIFPFILIYVSLAMFFPSCRVRWWQGVGLAGIVLVLSVWFAYGWPKQNIQVFNMSGGGLAGGAVNSLLLHYFRFWGSILVMVCLSLVFLQLGGGFSWAGVIKGLRGFFSYLCTVVLDSRPPEVEKRADRSGNSKGKKGGKSSGEKKRKSAPANGKSGQKPNLPARIDADRSFPPLGLLKRPAESRTAVDDSELEVLGRLVRECLEEFGIRGDVQKTQPGPVITMLEFKPAPGVKVSRIANLNDDLARALKAVSVRIIAPMPGRDTVGIEIPNKRKKTVYLREILESPAFSDTGAPLPLVLGQDIQGVPCVEDLARMPHLLVAGATGTGKSVCLNSLIVSLLFKAGPQDLRFLLVDPKRIELAVYNDLPHLVHPVVTDMSLAQVALDWAVHEMERRYDAMARLGVRNIQAYNEKLAAVDREKEPELADLEFMPYLVVIIDELADLMLTAAKEVEVSIVRLAQLARAAGIHLILATQRPSVDVVTGIIKANFPSRIAFQVSSKHDSRTILDTAGAEYLLGQGDMLFKPGGGQLRRIHGSFLRDEEISAVVEFWKNKGGGEESVDLSRFKDDNNSQFNGGDDGDPVLDDPRYGEAVEFVMEHGKASISLIQRRLRIGFNKAALFIEQMEKDGVIGPQEGSKPRQVLKKSVDR